MPPQVSLADLRAACGLTLDQVCERFTEFTGAALTRGALSAIENGHRGASVETLAGLEAAYGLRRDALSVEYTPRGAHAVPAPKSGPRKQVAR